MDTERIKDRLSWLTGRRVAAGVLGLAAPAAIGFSIYAAGGAAPAAMAHVTAQQVVASKSAPSSSPKPVTVFAGHHGKRAPRSAHRSEARFSPVTMYDTAQSGGIPGNARVVAGYVDGKYATYSGLVHSYPHAVHVSITVFGSTQASVLDVEPGCASVSQVRGWIQARHAMHKSATVYTSLQNLGSVWAAGKGLRFYVWVADWTKVQHSVPNTVAVQWIDNLHDGKTYDINTAFNAKWLAAVRG